MSWFWVQVLKVIKLTGGRVLKLNSKNWHLTNRLRAKITFGKKKGEKKKGRVGEKLVWQEVKINKFRIMDINKSNFPTTDNRDFGRSSRNWSVSYEGSEPQIWENLSLYLGSCRYKRDSWQGRFLDDCDSHKMTWEVDNGDLRVHHRESTLESFSLVFWSITDSW